MNNLVTRESEKYTDLFTYDDAMDRLRTVHLEAAKSEKLPLNQILASVKTLAKEIDVV